MRSWSFLLLVLAVGLTWAASGLTGRALDTYGFFFDTEQDTGNTITAGVLQPPTKLCTNGNTCTSTSSSVHLEWTPSVSADEGQRVFRATGACPGGGALPGGATQRGPDLSASATSFDDSASASTTYCYYIQAFLKNWTANSAPSQITTPSGVVTTTLLLHNNNTMTTTDGTAGVVSIAAADPDQSYVWSFTPTVGSTIQDIDFTLIVVQGTNPTNNDGASATIKVGYGADCSAMTPLVTSNVTIPKVGDDNGISFTLNPSGSHTFVAGEKLCLQVINTAAPASAARAIEVRTDDQSSTGAAGKSSLTVTLTGP